MNEAEIDQALAAAEQTLRNAQSGAMPQQPSLQQPAPAQLDPRLIQQMVDAAVRQALAGVNVIPGPSGADGMTPTHEHVSDIVHEVVAKTPLPKGDKGDPGERGPRGPRGEIVRTLERITDPRRMGESDGSSLVGFLQSGTGAITEAVADALRRFVHTAQYLTQLNYEAARDALTGTFGVGNLDVAGNLAIGNASGDVLTINAGSLGNDISLTRAAGTVATGNVDLWKLSTTFTGDAGGASLVYGFKVVAGHSGGNAINTIGAGRFLAQQNGTGAIGTMQPVIAEMRIDSAGNVAGALGVTSVFTIASTGSVTTSVQHYRVSSPTISGGGTVLAIYGMQISNMGHASITNVNGIYIDDQTSASGNMIGINLNVSSGTNKYNVLAGGTAFNFFQGNTGVVSGPEDSTALSLPLGTTARSTLRIPHGAAPTSPVNGDIWTTTSGLFVRVNGATVGPLT
jgi:hypothetical protein